MSKAKIAVIGAGLMGHGIAQVFALAGHEGGSSGRILGLAPGTVRVYLHRARLRLRDLLAGHVDGGRT